MITYEQVCALNACPRCGELAGVACRDLAITSETRRIITPHRERLNLVSTRPHRR